MTADGHPKLWRPGRDISVWPELKYARAASHFRDLQSRIQFWTSTYPMQVETRFSDDQRSVDLVLCLVSEPPVQEWALALGDALHNLRSSLDAVAWEFAHLDGANPPKPRQLYFPICNAEADWERQVREVLSTVPSEGLARMRLVQPFLYSPTNSKTRTSLDILSQLDNQDKHRSSIKCAVETTQLNMESIFVQFHKDDEIPDPPGSLEHFTDGRLRDDLVLLRLSSSARFEDVTMRSNLSLTVLLELDGTTFSLEQICNNLLFQVRGVLDILYRGIGTPVDSNGEGWKQFPVEMVQPVEPQEAIVCQEGDAK